MTSREPITPTRIIPAGEPLPLPAPASPPPPPPRPPAPPAVADPYPDWWARGSGPSGPPPPVPVDVHVHVTIDAGGPLVPVDSDPGPRWWQRIRIGYNLACAACGLGLSGPWAWVLASVRDEESLAGAWIMAAVPIAVVALLDNARRVEAAAAHPDLWAPKIRAAITRTLLLSLAEATALTLPVTTLVYLITGVQPS
ncbi:hypothetical protein QBA54_07490 [Streptomyces sp. B21-108]|uniref:hypothetical protein n=1 Tax=Streptomyces sp. B21-108 TaxID=3039419 RepID=UPI002FEF86FF